MGDLIECPICDAEVELDNDFRSGDEIYCTFCQSPLTVSKRGDKWVVSVEGED
jgi:hypothetical protein